MSDRERLWEIGRLLLSYGFVSLHADTLRLGGVPVAFVTSFDLVLSAVGDYPRRSFSGRLAGEPDGPETEGDWQPARETRRDELPEALAAEILRRHGR